MFQCKLLNNVLYLNCMLFRFRKVDSPRYLYCNEEETPPHLFHSCLNTKQLWNKLRQYLSQFINIPNSNPESSIVEICDNNQHSMLINHLLLSIKELEKELNGSNELKLLNKWRPIDHITD